MRIPDGEEQTVIEYDPTKGKLAIDFEKSSLDEGIEHSYYAMYLRKDGGSNPPCTKR